MPRARGPRWSGGSRRCGSGMNSRTRLPELARWPGPRFRQTPRSATITSLLSDLETPCSGRPRSGLPCTRPAAFGRSVAVKFPSGGERDGHGTRASPAFLREVSVTAALEHPGSCRSMAGGREGRLCYAMRLSGKDVKVAIAECHDPEEGPRKPREPLSRPEFRRSSSGSGRPAYVAYAHNGGSSIATSSPTTSCSASST